MMGRDQIDTQGKEYLSVGEEPIVGEEPSEEEEPERGGGAILVKSRDAQPGKKVQPVQMSEGQKNLIWKDDRRSGWWLLFS